MQAELAIEYIIGVTKSKKQGEINSPRLCRGFQRSPKTEQVSQTLTRLRTIILLLLFPSFMAQVCKISTNRFNLFAKILVL